jgi:hypothetical protein
VLENGRRAEKMVGKIGRMVGMIEGREVSGGEV